MAPTVEQVSYVCYLNSLIYSNIDVLSCFFSSVPKNLPIQNSVLTLVRVFIAIHVPLLLRQWLRVTSMKVKAGCNSNIVIYRTGLIFSFTWFLTLFLFMPHFLFMSLFLFIWCSLPFSVSVSIPFSIFTLFIVPFAVPVSDPCQCACLYFCTYFV